MQNQHDQEIDDESSNFIIYFFKCQIALQLRVEKKE